MRFFVLAALLGLAVASRVSYDGHKVLRFSPNLEGLEKLNEFKHRDGFDFWTEPRHTGANLDIMVSPEQQSRFFHFLEENGIGYTVLFDNIQEAIDAEDKYQSMMKLLTPTHGVSFDHYYRHNEISLQPKEYFYTLRTCVDEDEKWHLLEDFQINNYLHELANDYPHLVKLENIGKSYEGRDMVGIKISSGNSGRQPAILIDAGIHAREWIGPAMALYIIHQLVENNTANSDLTQGLDWYILPLLNPDGYEYSHSTDREWRKTRSPTYLTLCPGVDGNRNFGFHWKEVGASSNACDEAYAGSHAFSEIEMRNLRDFAAANRHNVKLYLTFHSYGGYFLYPWGYTSKLPSDWKTLQELAERVNAAHVAAGGESYKIGTSTNALYPASGGSDDYMKGVEGIELSYTVELTDTPFGYQLPPNLIMPTVTRFFEGIRVFGNYVKHNYKFAE